MSLSSFRQGTKIEGPRKCQKVALLKQTQTNFTGKVKVMKPLGGTKEIMRFNINSPILLFIIVIIQ